MKSGTRNLIAVAVGVVVLGGLVAVLQLTGKGEESSSSAETSSSIQLVSKKSEDVASMKVTNSKGGYTLVPEKKPAASSSVSSGSASSAIADDEVGYTVQGLEGLPVNTSETSSVIQNGFSLVASKDLGTVSDLGDYGLASPQATVDISFKDGSSYHYKIGKVSATDQSSYYMCGADSSNVYIVSVDSGLLENANYFIDKDLTAIGTTDENGNSTAPTLFTKIELSGKNYPQNVVLSKQGDDMKITAPEQYDTDSNKLSAVETALSSLSADTVEAVKPDAAALKQYGLDQPAAVVEFTADKKTYKLTAGAKKDGNYYVMFNDVAVVYGISSSKIGAWVEANLFAFRNRLIYLPNIETVKSFTVKVGDTENELNVARTKDESKSTEDKPAYTYKLTGNGGKTLDYEENYKNFYQTAIGVQLLEPADKIPEGKPDLTFEYRYFDKRTVDTIQFIKSADRRYTVVFNGKAFGVVTQDDIDAVKNSISLLESGKSVPEPA